jgi:predicted phage terminase large subunit-like protein
MQLDYYGELSKLCRESYLQFVKTFWPVVSTEKLVMNWHIPYLCNEIQYHSERVFAGEPKECDLICNISPGTSKSSIFSVLYTPWAWTRMPHLRYIGTSFAEDLAFELTVKSRRVVQSPLYQKLFPEIKLRDDINSKSLWSNTLGGDRYAVGTGGDIIGRHAHVIGIDDPINPKAGRSKAQIGEAAKYMRETLPSRKADKLVSWTYLVMQRISITDPTEVMLNSYPNVKLICLPGEETNDIQPPELRKYYKDGLFDPVRLPRSALDALRAQLGEYGYAGQILQRPIPPGGGALKVDRIFADHLAAPPERDFIKIVRYWDKAALAANGDYTVGVKMGMLPNGQIWILDIRRGQWDTDEREKIIVATAHQDGKQVRIGFEEEPGGSGKDAAREAARRLHGFRIAIEKNTGSKESRAEPFAIQVNMGNVHTALKQSNKKIWTDYIDELQYFPDGTNDDQVDASAGAYKLLTERTVRLGVLK